MEQKLLTAEAELERLLRRVDRAVAAHAHAEALYEDEGEPMLGWDWLKSKLWPAEKAPDSDRRSVPPVGTGWPVPPPLPQTPPKQPPGQGQRNPPRK